MNNISRKTQEQILQDVFYREIPISLSLGLQVKKYHKDQLTLFAPLEPNINHKCTAFGGSLYSVAVLAGWGMLYMTLLKEGLSGQIVIYESSVKYHKPVDMDFNAVCELTDADSLKSFIKILRKKGRGRIMLESRIMCGSDVAMSFSGMYVVHK